jgi:hypothetical protein
MTCSILTLTIFILLLRGKINHQSEKKSLYKLYFSVNEAFSSNNITQFDNLTIEWTNFNIFTCAVPATIYLSIFTCIRPNYTQVEDLSYLTEMTFDFQQSTCQSTATSTMVNTLNF